MVLGYSRKQKALYDSPPESKFQLLAYRGRPYRYTQPRFEYNAHTDDTDLLDRQPNKSKV